METVQVCPLGGKCEEARDGKVYRCAWYLHVQGEDPQTGEKINQSRCAMTWIPTLQIENTRAALGNQEAVESFRNEMVKGQAQAVKALSGMLEVAKLEYDDGK